MIEAAEALSRVQVVNTSNDQERDLRNREFVRLLAEHERRLEGYVHVLIPVWQDAEDVLQNTKLRLWEQFDSFRPDADFAAWAIAIAGYMVRTHRTLSRRQRVCFSDDLLEKISQHIPADSARQDNRILALVECVRALSDASRKLLRLCCTGQRKIKDIALELGQTPSATYSALYRIRWSLFDCVQERLQEGDGP
jgi:RNA polymerase sigma-70 factor, ECF subfamily